MASLSDHVTAICYSNDGDGSTSVEVLFADGSSLFQNADVLYDEDTVSVRKPDGSMSYPTGESELPGDVAALYRAVKARG